MALIRADKALADLGVASRKELKAMIRSGRVTVDGKVITRPEEKLDTESAKICLDGKALDYRRYHYYMMDKPAGVLSATEDGKQNTVLDILPPELKRQELFPVGRLDKDTTGLLLLTNDGDYAHRVISPKMGIVKKYLAQVDGELGEADRAAFKEGLVLGDGLHCLPAELELLSPGWCHVYVMEGKFHQVKRMLASRGAPVQGLRRLSIGGLGLDPDLGPGGWKELTDAERDRVFVDPAIDI